MKETCWKCGFEVPEGVTVCPKCKTVDPLGRIKDETERFLEEQVEKAGEPSKK